MSSNLAPQIISRRLRLEISITCLLAAERFPKLSWRARSPQTKKKAFIICEMSLLLLCSAAAARLFKLYFTKSGEKRFGQEE
jgi:hypothetical protein